ncbi:hypothetical protein BDV59DRAFT_120994 [Aspergillus ambiguus]|uniref:uncharacterized protein n=1 Tax=Aspergillus ambiguus TaxID=176160 RepID=UPI003CCCD578
MAFEAKPLDGSVDFNNEPENRVTMIIGRNQMVFWKGCNVTVYETDNDGNEQIRYLENAPDGQGLVGNGVKLYITRGKVKEGS